MLKQLGDDAIKSLVMQQLMVDGMDEQSNQSINQPNQRNNIEIRQSK
jgi:hypothetical protein